MSLLGIAAAIVVLGVLIVVHEFGHFIVAKRSGVGVLKFSIGFGPKLFGRTINGTEYVLSAIPLGGYVKMVGEDPDSEEPVDERTSFSHQPLWKRTLIVVAGPAFNVLFAFLAFSLILLAYGVSVAPDRAQVAEVRDGMPAAHAGFQAGDTITAVDGQQIAGWAELSEAIRASGGRKIEIDVRRGDQELTLAATPQARQERNVYGEVIGTTYQIGIQSIEQRKSVGLLEAFQLGAQQTAWWVKTIITSIFKLVAGQIPARDIGGPLLIAQAAAAQASIGLAALIKFMAVISINLGILNLLPIPVLDGGHLLFFVLEALMRRPLDERQRYVATQVGLVILIGLMAFAFYNDLIRELG